MQGYRAERGPSLMVVQPYDKKSASVGNGTMVALAAPSREAVDKTHAAALKSGGSDEGAPGLRGETSTAPTFATSTATSSASSTSPDDARQAFAANL